MERMVHVRVVHLPSTARLSLAPKAELAQVSISPTEITMVPHRTQRGLLVLTVVGVDHFALLWHKLLLNGWHGVQLVLEVVWFGSP